MPDLDRIFAELGMAYPSGSINSGAPPPPPPPAPGMSDELLRKQMLQERGIDHPQALDRHGIVKQLMWGITSPITDTARKLGQMDPMPKPATTGEIIAHAAGGILGWAALGAIAGAVAAPLVAAVPALGVLSTSTLTAPLAGLAKSATAAKAITSIGRSVMIGGAYGVHTAWVQEQPVGKGALQGMAFGAVFGGIGFGVGLGAEKLGMMRKTSEQFMEEVLAKHPILHTQDLASMAEAGNIGSLLEQIPEHRAAGAVQSVIDKLEQQSSILPSKPGNHDIGLLLGASFNKLSPKDQMEHLVKALGSSPEADTLLEPVLDVTRAVKSRATLLSGRITNYTRGRAKEIVTGASPAPVEITPEYTKSMSSHQRGLVTEMAKAKTLGEQFKTFDKLRARLQQAQGRLKKKYDVTDFAELLATNKATSAEINAYINREATMQDLTWQLGNHLSKAAHGHPSVNLPSLNAIQDPYQGAVYWKTLQGEVEAGRANLQYTYHKDYIKFFSEINKKEGKSYSGTTFLPEKYQKAYDEMIQKIVAEGGTPITAHHNLISFPIPKDVMMKDIPEFIQKATAMPYGGTYTPLSIADSLIMETSMLRGTWMGRMLTPVRHALGEGFTNQIRGRVQAHQTFVDGYSKKVATWLEKLGYKDKKYAAARAVVLGERLEGQVPEALQTRLRDAATRVTSYSSKPSKNALQKIASEFGVTENSLDFVWRKINKIRSDPELLSSFNAYSKTTGVPLEEYAAQYLLGTHLQKAGRLTGKAAQKAVEEFGLESTAELKVLFEMRNELDKLFRASGLDIDRYIPGYLPRFRDNKGKNFEELVDIFAKQKIPEKEIQGYLWMNELSRTAKGTGYSYDMDAFRSFQRYVSGYSKSTHFGDSFFEPWVEHFKKTGMSNDRMQVLKDIRHWMVGRPSEAEKQMDSLINQFVDVVNLSEWQSKWGIRPTAEISSLLAELQYIGGMGFNPFTAVKNLTQKALALSSITDDGNPLHGLKWMAKAKAKKLTKEGEFYLTNLKLRDARNFTESLEMQSTAISRVMQKMGLPDPMSRAAVKFRDEAFRMFRWSDLSNIEDTWLARFLYLTETKSAPWSDAINLATKTTMATQFMYGADSPLLYKSPIGKQAGIFMSWPINWAFMLYEQGTSGDMHRAIATVLTMAVGAEALTLTGMNFMSIHPVNTARGLLPIAMLEGEDRWPLLYRSAAATWGVLKALSEGDPEAYDTALANLKQRLIPMIPAGVVGKRVVDFVDLARHEWRKYDRKDRLKYETTVGEAARSVFGPTTEAYERVNQWQQVSKMEGYYRHARGQAIQAFLNHDYVRFQKLQEQLIVNFGKWIEPKDIRYERQLREMTARERQLISLPADLRDPFLEMYGK